MVASSAKILLAMYVTWIESRDTSNHSNWGLKVTLNNSVLTSDTVQEPNRFLRFRIKVPNDFMTPVETSSSSKLLKSTGALFFLKIWAN